MLVTLPVEMRLEIALFLCSPCSAAVTADEHEFSAYTPAVAVRTLCALSETCHAMHGFMVAYGGVLWRAMYFSVFDAPVLENIYLKERNDDNKSNKLNEYVHLFKRRWNALQTMNILAREFEELTQPRNPESTTILIQSRDKDGLIRLELVKLAMEAVDRNINILLSFGLFKFINAVWPFIVSEPWVTALSSAMIAAHHLNSKLYAIPNEYFETWEPLNDFNEPILQHLLDSKKSILITHEYNENLSHLRVALESEFVMRYSLRATFPDMDPSSPASNMKDVPFFGRKVNMQPVFKGSSMTAEIATFLFPGCFRYNGAQFRGGSISGSWVGYYDYGFGTEGPLADEMVVMQLSAMEIGTDIGEVLHHLLSFFPAGDHRADSITKFSGTGVDGVGEFNILGIMSTPQIQADTVVSFFKEYFSGPVGLSWTYDGIPSPWGNGDVLCGSYNSGRWFMWRV